MPLSRRFLDPSASLMLSAPAYSGVPSYPNASLELNELVLPFGKVTAGALGSHVPAFLNPSLGFINAFLAHLFWFRCVVFALQSGVSLEGSVCAE